MESKDEDEHVINEHKPKFLYLTLGYEPKIYVMWAKHSLFFFTLPIKSLAVQRKKHIGANVQRYTYNDIV